MAPRPQITSPIPHGCAFPSTPEEVIPSALGSFTQETWARIRLFNQGHNSPLADMGVQPTSCSGQQGIRPQSLHSSALRKKLHMAKWRYEMVKIYGFGVLSRLLWWFRVGSEPKPLITRRDLGGIWNLDPLLKSPSDSSLATDMVFYGFISIPEGYFHACLAADRGGGDLYMIYIQGNAYITTSLFP